MWYVYAEGEDCSACFTSRIDVFDRGIIDYHLGLSCKGKDALWLLERCLWRRGLVGKGDLPVIRTDNGSQFISNVFEEGCTGLGVEHERIPPKTPNMNAHIESFHAQIERELLARVILETFQETYKEVSDYIHFYCNNRIHGSIFDMAPVKFLQAVNAGEVIGKQVRV